MLTAREVAAAGGHAGVMEWRRAVLAGARAPGLAGGGPVATAPRYSAPLLRLSAPGGGSGALDRSLTQHIYTAPGMSPAEVARLSADERNWAEKEA